MFVHITSSSVACVQPYALRWPAPGKQYLIIWEASFNHSSKLIDCKNRELDSLVAFKVVV